MFLIIDFLLMITTIIIDLLLMITIIIVDILLMITTIIIESLLSVVGSSAPSLEPQRCRCHKPEVPKSIGSKAPNLQTRMS